MNRKKYCLKALALVLFILTNLSCTSYLENPLKDKETGEDIDLLVIDPSVFPVRLNISLIDAGLKSAVLVPAVVSFSGKNDNDIMTLKGKKQAEFFTAHGFLELAVDPKVVLNQSEPLSFTIHVRAEGYPETSRDCVIDSLGVTELKMHL